MAEIAKWQEYHRRCDEWSAVHGYDNEREFIEFVANLTLELGL